VLLLLLLQLLMRRTRLVEVSQGEEGSEGGVARGQKSGHDDDVCVCVVVVGRLS
jgi:hypothetical protein